MKIALRAEYTGTDGRKFLVVHGDEYDTATVKSWYAVGEFFLSIGYSADALMRAIGLMEKYSLAAAFKRRVKKIINKQMGISAAIEKSIDDSPYDGMIYGHTHMKGYHRSPGGKIIINDGCCTDHVQFAVQDKFGTWGLIEFHRKHMNVELEDGTTYNVHWKDHGLEHFGAMPPDVINDEYTAKAERLLRLINRLWPSQCARAGRLA